MNREYNKAFFKKFDNDWLPQIFSRQQKYNGKWRLESCDENQLRAEPSTKPFDQQTADCNRLKTWLMREIIAVHKLDDRIGSNKSVKDNMPLLNLWVDEILKMTRKVSITSNEFMKMLHDLGFGDQAARFVQEYNCFATSKFDTIDDWDNFTKYLHVPSDVDVSDSDSDFNFSDSDLE